MRKMISYAEYGLRILLTLTGIAGVLLFIFPRVAGCTPRIVVSGSMEPAVPVGSITYTCPNIPPEQIETGDVIAYELKNGIAVLHRVVKKDAEKEIWVTQGDANETEDPAAVSYGQYLGEMVFHVPYAGYVANWLQKKKILFLAVAAAVLLLIVHPTGEERRQIT